MILFIVTITLLLYSKILRDDLKELRRYSDQVINQQMELIDGLNKKVNSLSNSEAWWQNEYEKINSTNINAKEYYEIIDSYEKERKQLQQAVLEKNDQINKLMEDTRIRQHSNRKKPSIDFLDSKPARALREYNKFQKSTKEVRDAELV